jgi:hypothetical protein
MLMRRLQNTKRSTKASTTISALLDAKSPLKQTPKNISVETRQVTTVVAVKTTVKSLLSQNNKTSFYNSDKLKGEKIDFCGKTNSFFFH